MKKKSRVPSLVTIAVLTAITLVFWVFFTAYRAFTTKPSPSVPEDILQALTPTLDTDSLSKIQSRTFLSEGEIGGTKITGATPSATTTPTPSPTITPTPSASPSATPTATASATPTP
ncbi:hypothetical protein MUP46_01690 [Patescibacteria group bacterium]|nr:hypothetical protein [Patescibacteria group bacterium]